MFRLTTDRQLPGDVTRVVERCQQSSREQSAGGADSFRSDSSIWITRAPGRMDVMGGIADYSGSLVLQMPIREAAVGALQREPSSRQIRLQSPGAVDRSAAFAFQLDDLMSGDAPVDYDTARRFFGAESQHSWSAYLGGAFVVLMRECGIHFDVGCHILLDSQVPEGKGVSSSAAIEVATMMAICAAYDIELAPRELAILCQKVENLVVGAPCGIMDQLACACGEKDRLLAILCQPAQLLGTICLPDDLTVWGIDSGIRHAVSGADYGSVRTGAFMGLQILRQVANVQAGPQDRWAGYLANVSPHEWMQWASQVPAVMKGDAFAKTYGGIEDTVTQVEAQRDYAVLAPTAHPIEEHQRHRTFAELLLTRETDRRNELLGELMFQTHASYSLCGLGSDGTDELAAAVDQPESRAAGLFGAKITGGGSGGTVAILGASAAEGYVEQIAATYAAGHELSPYIFTGSSPGAAQFGVVRLDPN
ncbi:MAG: GHMP kinase [Gemmatimonadetes bacterium]|nr:GHMP kinase [Gemmatimonadota bacterium]